VTNAYEFINVNSYRDYYDKIR